jgi:hypothetical protein
MILISVFFYYKINNPPTDSDSDYHSDLFFDQPSYKAGYASGLLSGKRDKAYQTGYRSSAQVDSDAHLISGDTNYIQAYHDGYVKGYETGPK